MKKIFLLVFIILFNINFLQARNIYEKELPKKFKKECFKYSSSYYFSNKNDWKYKIKLNKSDAIAVRWNYLVPIIPYRKLWKEINYTSTTFKNTKKINDNNLKTYSEIILDWEKFIVLKFAEWIKKNSFVFNFKHSAKNYYPEVYISNDWKKYSLIRFDNISDFDFKYLKIIFKPKDINKIKKEIVKIKELSFTKKKDIKLIKVEWGGKVYFYSSYNCSDYINLNTIPIWFSINKNTPEVNIELEKNPNYNPNIEKDSDWDWIDNYIDNCIDIYNPMQKDTDADWVWDACSHINWIIWKKNSSSTIFSSDQKDLNNNWIWDKYNKKYKNFFKSNKLFIIFIILIIIAIFGFIIYYIIQKLNNWDWNFWFQKKDIIKKETNKKNKIKKEKFLNWKSYTKAKKENIEVDL